MCGASPQITMRYANKFSKVFMRTEMIDWFVFFFFLQSVNDQGSAIDQDIGPPISGDSNNNYKTIKNVSITFLLIKEFSTFSHALSLDYISYI